MGEKLRIHRGAVRAAVLGVDGKTLDVVLGELNARRWRRDRDEADHNIETGLPLSHGLLLPRGPALPRHRHATHPAQNNPDAPALIQRELSCQSGGDLFF